MIRPAAEHDADAVVDLWTEAYVTRGVGGRVEPYARADFFESARHGEVFVAERAGKIVGVVVLFAPEAPGRAVGGPGEAELSRLAVAFAMRRRGIGRALARFCERRAQAARWGAIALWSRPGQTEAHRLYESLGYRRAPERDSTDRSGHRRMVFRRALTPPPPLAENGERA
jgi:ribosomal protein S18 acetylase RimI-like enzyme